MRQYLSAMLAFGIAIAFTTPSRAGALDLLKGDGSVNSLSDVDFEEIVDNGDGSLGTGDVFVGIFTFTEINGQNTPTYGASFSGVLVAQITNVDGGRLTFGAVSATDYTALQNGTFGALGGIALSNLPTRASADSALIVYDDTTFINPDPNNAFFINPDGTGTDFTGINNSLTSATDGTKDFEFGFTGTTYAQADITVGDITTFEYALALNETFNATNLSILPISSAQSGVFNLDNNALPITSIHSSGGTASTAAGVGDYTYRTNVDSFLRVVPEPTSMTLLALGGLTLLGAGFRRKRKSGMVA